MMCVCRRCQRLAAAMDDDALDHVDDDIADLMELAFQVAHVHGAWEIGFEHVLHAMTSFGAGYALLEHAGVDVALLRQEAAHVMAHTHHAMTHRDSSSPEAPAVEADVAAALQLAVEEAHADGFDDAQLQDLLGVMMGYQPGDDLLVDLFAVLQIGTHGAEQQRQFDSADVGSVRFSEAAWQPEQSGLRPGDALADGTWSATDVGPTRVDALDVNVALHALGERFTGIETRAEEDRQRIVHALHELSRQRAYLPGAEDWRSQMQALVTQLDVMQRALADVTSNAVADSAVESGHNNVARLGAINSEQHFAKRDAEVLRERLVADTERDRRIAELNGMLERQVLEVERLSRMVARLEHDRVSSEPKREEPPQKQDQNQNQKLSGRGTGAASTAMAASAAAASAAAMLGFSFQRGSQSSTETTRARTTSNAPELVARQEKSRPTTASEAGATSKTGRRRRSQSRYARVRHRTNVRVNGLRLARVAQLGLSGRPKRRERSWWRWLNDRARWRVERQRGGRFRTFGERFDHRGRASSRNVRGIATASAASTKGRQEDKRFYLSMDDDIVDAPSIGPKTAERLRPARIFKVRDLLQADAEEVAQVVSARHITAQAVRDWQDQARLVIMVPFLRGTHAQLLVGAGFRNFEEIALADQATLMSALLRFATTREGQSVLRNGPPPDLEKVVKWMEHALESEPARAA